MSGDMYEGRVADDCAVGLSARVAYFLNKNTLRYKKNIKIRDDDFKTMIVNYSVNDCQFEDKLLFLGLRNATRCISDPKQNRFMPLASEL
jgi:hypothetical protein